MALGFSAYLVLRRRFAPARLRLVIVAESPPRSGTYFYDPEGRATEHLYSALTHQLGLAPRTPKPEGLAAFAARGWALIDATYEPVNGLTNAGRKRVILRDYPKLRDDLGALARLAPIVLVKANVCRLLDAPLTEDGLAVANRGRVIPFPAAGRQGEFRVAFSEVIEELGV